MLDRGDGMKLKQGAAALAAAMLLCTAPCGAACLEEETSAASAVVYDAWSGETLFEHNKDVRRGMASTTKIMTALVALEQYDPAAEVEIDAAWCGAEGSSMYLRPGETLTVEDLLYGLLLESGNDAAMALAGLDPEGCGGFVEKMNEKARALGLENTHFCNPSGLSDPEHYTTALELAQITAAAMTDPRFAAIVGTRSTQRAGRTLHNHNRLLELPGFCGVKTGYTKATGRCLVSAVENGGRMLLCVTLDDRDDWADHARLLAKAQELYSPQTVIGAGDCGSVPILSGDKGESRLYCTESVDHLLREEERGRVRLRLEGPRMVYAPTRAGQRYGTLRAMLGERCIGESPVYFAADCGAEAPKRTWWERLLARFFPGETEQTE